MKNSSLLMIIAALIITMSSVAQTTGILTDSRDRQTYLTISINNPLKGTTVIWMVQNLNYKVSDSWAYNNDESNRKNLGLLYTWHAAKQACPSGWHLPSDADWDVLINTFGGKDKAGEALKSTKVWKGNGNGTNRSGFTALPGGSRLGDGTFGNIGDYCHWWSSTEGGAGRAWARTILYDGSNVYRDDVYETSGFSVRCIRD